MTAPDTDALLGRLVVALAAVILPTGLLFAWLGWSDLAMLRSWPRADATVTAAPTARRLDQAGLTLLAETPSGRVEGRTIRPVAGVWLDPHPAPRHGERVAVVIDPHDPRRMATVDSLRWSWLGIGSAAATLALGVALAAAAVAEVANARRPRPGAQPAP